MTISPYITVVPDGNVLFTISEGAGDRTQDPQIKSLLLYRLSYAFGVVILEAEAGVSTPRTRFPADGFASASTIAQVGQIASHNPHATQSRGRGSHGRNPCTLRHSVGQTCTQARQPMQLATSSRGRITPAPCLPRPDRSRHSAPARAQPLRRRRGLPAPGRSAAGRAHRSRRDPSPQPSSACVPRPAACHH